MPYRSDFAQQATEQWILVLPDLDVSVDELTAAVRLSRLSSMQDQIDERSLREFDRQGIRSLDDFKVIAYLRRNPAGSGNAQLVELLGGSKSGMSNRLDRFVASGLLERIDSETDRRLHTNHLTPKGNELADQLVHAIVAGRRRMFESITADQIQQFSHTLADIIQHLDS